MDVFDRETRSRVMSRVKQKDTRPELVVRKLLHAMGFRYRLHVKDLPGRPDIVLPKYRSAIFVHGCFWHGHTCPRGRLPVTNAEFWREKIEGNVSRDAKQLSELRDLGYRTEVIWECEIRDLSGLADRLSDFLCSPSN